MRPFTRVELLQAINCKVLSINHTRVSLEKGYGLMSVIAAFDIATGDILDAIDAKPEKRAQWVCMNEDENTWACSNCNEEWNLEAGTPMANQMRFCTFCGAAMNEAEREGGEQI